MGEEDLALLAIGTCMYMFEVGQLVEHDAHGLVEVEGSIIRYTDEIDVEPDYRDGYEEEVVIIGGKGVEEYIEFTPHEAEDAETMQAPVAEFVRATVGIDTIDL